MIVFFFFFLNVARLLQTCMHNDTHCVPAPRRWKDKRGQHKALFTDSLHSITFIFHLLAKYYQFLTKLWISILSINSYKGRYAPLRVRKRRYSCGDIKALWNQHFTIKNVTSSNEKNSYLLYFQQPLLFVQSFSE